MIDAIIIADLDDILAAGVAAFIIALFVALFRWAKQKMGFKSLQPHEKIMKELAAEKKISNDISEKSE